MINLTNSNRKVRVIDPLGGGRQQGSGRRLKCEECGQPEVHIYKLDPSFYFCGHCANKTAITKEIKHELVIAPSGEENKTFIVQAPRRRKVGKRGILEEQLIQSGFEVKDYYEIQPQPD